MTVASKYSRKAHPPSEAGEVLHRTARTAALTQGLPTPAQRTATCHATHSWVPTAPIKDPDMIGRTFNRLYPTENDHCFFWRSPSDPELGQEHHGSEVPAKADCSRNLNEIFATSHKFYLPGPMLSPKRLAESRRYCTALRSSAWRQLRGDDALLAARHASDAHGSHRREPAPILLGPQRIVHHGQA